MASAVFPSTRKTTNYGRLSRLLVDICPCVLRDTLSHRVPLAKFHTLILQKKQSLWPLMNASQKHLLYPISGSFTGTYNDFDLSFLYLLLRNLSGIKAHRNRWGKDPDPLDRCLSANIERLRIARNTRYGHLSGGSVDDLTFISIWCEIKHAIVEIEATLPPGCKTVSQYEDEVDNLETTSMDPEKEQEYIKLLEGQRKVDLETRELIKDVKGELQKQVSQTSALQEQITGLMGDIGHLDKKTHNLTDDMLHIKDHVKDISDKHTEDVVHLQDQMKDIDTRIQNTSMPKHVQAQHQLIISTWQEEDRFFIETRAYKHVYRICQQNKCTTVVGNSGAGKSAIAHRIALKLQTQGYTIVPVISSDEIRRYADPSRKQVFVVDDPVGKEGVDLVRLTNMESCNDFIKTMLDKSEIKLIFTCRMQVVGDQKVSLSRTILAKNVINLHDKSLSLTDKEKMHMFEIYTKDMKVKLPTSTKNLIISVECFNFPLLCRMFGRNEQFQKKEKSFFDDMFNVLAEELDTLKNREKLQFCALVLCMMFDDDFDIEVLDAFSRNEKVQQITEACGLPSSTSRKDIVDAMESLVNVYLIRESRRYRFIHDTLYEATAYEFGKTCPKEILKHCTSSFFRERIRVSLSEEGHFIVIQPKEYDLLSERIGLEIEKGNFHDIFLNPLILDEGFLKMFIQYLDKIPKQVMRHIFMEVEPNLEQFEQFLDKQGSVHDLKNLRLLSTEDIKAIHWVLAKNIKQIFIFLHTKLNHFEPNIKTKIIQKISRRDKRDNYLSLIPYACLGGNIDTLNMLLKNGYSGSLDDVLDEYDMSTLHMAVASGNVDMVEMVIIKGADINIKSAETPLHFAAYFGSTNICQLLLEYGCCVNVCTHDGDSPLLFSAVCGHTDTARLLLEHGAAVNKRSNTGESPLYVAVSEENTETARLLLQHGAAVDMRCNTGETPLYVAVSEEYTEIVRLLLEFGANVNMYCNTGETPLFVAVSEEYEETARLLLDYWANANKCNNDGISPLYYTASNGFSEIVRLLLKHGAHVNIRNNDGKTPLYIASALGKTDIVHLLLEHEANVNKCNCAGKSPLYIASAMGKTDILHLLLAYGANVNMCEKRFGETALKVAVRQGHNDIVRQLLDSGADVNICNTITGESPLIGACREGNVKAVELLLEFNADVHIVNKYGQSARHVALMNEHNDIAKLLKKMVRKSLKC